MLIFFLTGKRITDKLNHSFEKAKSHNFTSGGSHAEETQEELRRVYINYGNQPSLPTAWLFNYSGAPWLTQYWSWQVIQKVYSGLSPEDGYNGDEDQGQMGHWPCCLKWGYFRCEAGHQRSRYMKLAALFSIKLRYILTPIITKQINL